MPVLANVIRHRALAKQKERGTKKQKDRAMEKRKSMQSAQGGNEVGKALFSQREKSQNGTPEPKSFIT